MGAFLSGLVSGGVKQANKNADDSSDGKGSKLKGLLKKKKKGRQGSGETDYEGTMSFKRGGKVKRTGRARVHKGEQVLTTKQAKRYRRTKQR